MCFSYKVTPQKLEGIKKKLDGNGAVFGVSNDAVRLNGFTHPKAPVITSERPDALQLYEWGLMPHWAKDKTIQNNTLNARMETINEKPSFRDCVNQRCLIPADGFFEWQWLDSKGNNKQQYQIHLPDERLFYFAGIWSRWVDKGTGELLETYTILTTEANPLMAEIHNTKKRMPVIIDSDSESEWLKDNKICMVNDLLTAERIGNAPSNLLF